MHYNLRALNQVPILFRRYIHYIELGRSETCSAFFKCVNISDVHIEKTFKISPNI